MKKVALGLLISATAISAHAQPNFSGELLIGLADQTTDFDEFGSVSDEDASFGIRGAYNFNENLAIELAYQNYGEISDNYADEEGSYSDQFSASAITAGAKGSIPLQNGFSVSARLGMSKWEAEVDSTESGLAGDFSYSDDDDGTDLYYGVGMQFEMNEVFTVGAEYTITEMGISLFEASADHEVKNLAIFISYTFQ